MKKNLMFLSFVVLLSMSILSIAVQAAYYCEWTWPQKIIDKDSKAVLYNCPSATPYCQAGTTNCCKYDSTTKVYSSCVNMAGAGSSTSGGASSGGASSPSQTSTSPTTTSPTASSPTTTQPSTSTPSSSGSLTSQPGATTTSGSTATIGKVPTATAPTTIVDPCTKIKCNATKRECPDGFEASCTPKCSIGRCGSCNPDCSGHAKSEAPPVNQTDEDSTRTHTAGETAGEEEQEEAPEEGEQEEAAPEEEQEEQAQEGNETGLKQAKTPELGGETKDEKEQRIKDMLSQGSRNVSVQKVEGGYSVEQRVATKLFGLIPVDMDVETHLGDDLSTISQKKPWWSIMTWGKSRGEGKGGEEKPEIIFEENRNGTVARYMCCADDIMNPSWKKNGRMWVPETDQCPEGSARNYPDQCDVYPTQGSCSRLCTNGTLVDQYDGNGYCNCILKISDMNVFYCCDDKRWSNNPCSAHKAEFCRDTSGSCSKVCAAQKMYGTIIGKTEGNTADRYKCQCYGTLGTVPVFYCGKERTWNSYYVGNESYPDSYCKNPSSPENLHCSEKCALQNMNGTIMKGEPGKPNIERCQCYTGSSPNPPPGSPPAAGNASYNASVMRYKCCVDNEQNPGWGADKRKWVDERLNCPSGLIRGWPDHCDVYPTVKSCSRLCPSGTMFNNHSNDGYCNCYNFQVAPPNEYFCCGKDPQHMSVKNTCTDNLFNWQDWQGASVRGPSCWNTRCNEYCISFRFAQGQVSNDKKKCYCSGTYVAPTAPNTTGEPVFYCNKDKKWVTSPVPSYEQYNCLQESGTCFYQCLQKGKMGYQTGKRQGEYTDRYKCECFEPANISTTPIPDYNYYKCCGDNNLYPSRSYMVRVWTPRGFTCPTGLYTVDPKFCQEYAKPGNCSKLCQDGRMSIGSVSTPIDDLCYCPNNIPPNTWAVRTGEKGANYDINTDGDTAFLETHGKLKMWVYGYADTLKGNFEDRERMRGYQYVTFTVYGPEGQKRKADIDIEVWYSGVIYDQTNGISIGGSSVTDHAAVINVGIMKADDIIDNALVDDVWSDSTDLLANFLVDEMLIIAGGFLEGGFGDMYSIINTGVTSVIGAADCTRSITEERTVTFEDVELEPGTYKAFISLDAVANVVAQPPFGVGFSEIDFYNTEPDTCDNHGKDNPDRGIRVWSVDVDWKD